MTRTLALIASACGGADTRLRPELVEPAIALGWRVAVTFTPSLGRWMDASGEGARIQRLTELPVRHGARLPTEPKPYPMPDAFLFAPASANSVAKLALGIADNQALTAANEAIGTPGTPVVVLPRTAPPARAHPAWAGHLAVLRGAGVTVVDQAPASWTDLLGLFAAP
ncbi:flavoprotein [Actinokineospora bangkokensis]|uniref:Flavoprotein n=1 Tax=Actinokineospora bangkokensis TaxID=1193682 RepID=A0A1Q9LIH1_9PSEU|nr:flavoprotein [Actinokineospora bangkokensis]OLR91789.1 flavoprotein [Actinokineospora bangkokensis]